MPLWISSTRLGAVYACCVVRLFFCFRYRTESPSIALFYWANAALPLDQFHELLAGLGLLEDAREVRCDGHGVLFLHASHLHA